MFWKPKEPSLNDLDLLFPNGDAGAEVQADERIPEAGPTVDEIDEATEGSVSERPADAPDLRSHLRRDINDKLDVRWSLVVPPRKKYGLAVAVI